jgi:acyl-CoA thioesterase-2
MLHTSHSESALPDGTNAQAALAYMSDVWIVYAAILPHITFNNLGLIRIGTVNHALWFFQPWQPNEWLFVNAGSPAFGSSRGLSNATIYDRSGRMLAMAVSEAVYTDAVPSRKNSSRRFGWESLGS